MVAERSLSPIQMTAVGSLSTGQRQEMSPDRLTNRNGVPLWIDGLRFVLKTSVAGVGLATTSLNNGVAGQLIRATIEVGRHQITRTRTPLILCARWADYARELAQDVANNINANAIASQGAANGFNAVDPLTFVWRFPKPLYLPNRQSLTVILDYDIAGTTGAFTFEVVAYGRRLPKDFKPPDLVPVPYATYWLDASRNPGAISPAIIANSTPVDLGNPFNTPLFVKEFRGNYVVSNLLAPPLLFNFDGLRPFGGSSQNTNRPIRLGYRDVTVQMINSGDRPSSEGEDQNNFLVRDYTPWNHLFDVTTQSWLVNTRFNPHRWAHLRIRYFDPSGVSHASNAATAMRFGAGMVGYRMVRSQDLEIPS